MQIRGFSIAASVAVLSLACTDPGGGGGEQTFDATVFGDGTINGSDGGGGDGGGGGTEEHLRLSYVKSVAFEDGTPPQVDLWIYDFVDDETFNVTGGDEAGVNCRTRQCELSPDMSWVAWLEPGGGAGGFELWAAPVDVKNKSVKVDEKHQVNDEVNGFRFTSDLIVYSRGQAVGPTGEIEIWVEPVSGPDEAACPDDKTRCQSIAGIINGNGGFRVTKVSNLIILIKTTLSSMTLDFYNASTGATQTLFTFGEQDGTGSEFDGRQPIGLATDSRYLAVFTRNEMAWRINALQAVPNPPAPAIHALFPTDTNREGTCNREMPYNFNEVRFDPVFTADAGHFYFLAKGDCSRRAGADPMTNRDDFDVLRMDRDLAGEVKNVTNNPRVNSWTNHNIGDFDLDPDGLRVAFTASRPDNATSRSIWLLDEESGAYDCSRGSELPAFDDRTRCEFIFDDTANAEIVHRDLKFHKGDVPN